MIMLNLLQDPPGLLKEPKKFKPGMHLFLILPDIRPDIWPDIKKAGYLARYKKGRIIRLDIPCIPNRILPESSSFFSYQCKICS